MAWNSDEADMQDFVERHGLSFPSAADPRGAIFQRFGVTYQPAWAFVDAAGNVVTEQRALDPDELRERLEALAAA